MIIILGKSATYKLNDEFPMFHIPVSMEGATTQSLSDFQWWAYSSDFQKWLKENPREWTADSEDMAKYGSLENFIKENFEQRIEFSNSDKVLEFEKFSDEYLFEEEDQDKSGQILKFRYAYNQLLSEGKIKKEFMVDSQNVGDEKAIFLSLDDDKKEEIAESLTAYKITRIPTSENSKMALFKISEMLPGGAVSDGDNTESIIKKVSENVIQASAYVASGLAAYYLLGAAGSAYGAFYLRKRLLNLLPQKPGDKFARLRKIVKRNKNVKVLFGKLNPVKILSSAGKAGKFYSGVGKALAKGSSWFNRSKKFGGNLTQALKAFTRGTAQGLKTVKAGVEWVPVIGWTLAAIDVVGSTWNWFSGKQAPRYGEIDTFAKNEFIPKSIPVGVPITLCWSQEAGGAWGTVVNFIANNDTRTTMELVKVGDFNGKSIFILTQINSKELGKQLADHDLTLISFNSSEKVETGVIDNDDLEFEISTIDEIAKLSLMMNFKGLCEWTEILTAYESSSSSLFIEDPNAPKKYRFYFEDKEGEKINVSGSLITTDELSKFQESDFQKYFGLPSAQEEGLESDFDWDRVILESKGILSFEDFSIKSFSVNEEDEPQTEDQTEEINLKSSEMREPRKVAIYRVDEKQYADPELRGKIKPGDFDSFVVDPEFWKVSDGTRIDVLPNSDEILEDPIKGVYTWQEGKEVETIGDEEKGDQAPAKKKRGEKGEELPDDYYITVSPDDVKIKKRERSTTIRDYNVSGGLNPFDKFLTPRQKEILGIDSWKQITFAKEFYDKRGDIIEVKLKNKFAPFGDRSRKYRVVDGESFEIAKKFVEETRERIKYE